MPLVLDEQIMLESEYAWNPCIFDVPKILSVFADSQGELLFNIEIVSSVVKISPDKIDSEDIERVFNSIKKQLSA